MNLFFSTIDVSRQVFHRTALTFAIVNLKPIVPGHVLVCPARPVPRLKDLNTDELAALMGSVQRVGNVIEKAYGADALTVACQDGSAAGQSIPHVHFHLLPRKDAGDRFSHNDDIYPALEKHEAGLKEDEVAVSKGKVEALRMDADEDRKPRSMEEMEKEAGWLKSFFTDGPHL